jgi:hypothetical protein
VYFGFEHQTFGVEEQMALSAFDLLWRGRSRRALCLPLPWSWPSVSPQYQRWGAGPCQGDTVDDRAAQRSSARRCRRYATA